MTEADKHGCATCRWAKFEMTSHKPPRINKHHYGECEWPMPDPFPIALSMNVPYFHRSKVWAHMINCPVWETKT